MNQTRTDHQWAQLRRRGENIDPILDLRKKGYAVRWLSHYSLRVADRLDLFPTSRRFFDLKTKERGEYEDPLTLCRERIGL